jgi:hypothetical protein
MFGDADLPVFFADFGVPVIFNGRQAMGNLDNPMAVKLADQGYGGVVTELPSIRLPHNAFRPMPRPNDRILVDGQDYSVTEPAAQEDGAVVMYELKRTSR